MNTILVPVDFSEHSEHAMEVAAQLARKTDAEILAVHMLPIADAVLTKDDSQSFLQAKFYMELARKRFSDFLNRPYLEGIKVSETVKNHKVFHEIGDLALEEGADLIVMGSHGTSGISEIFVGSNTEKVVRTSTVPVLVIKERRKDFNLKKAVFAFDFKLESLAAYKRAIGFLQQLQVNIHLVHVNLPGINFMNTTSINKEIATFMRTAHHGQVPDTILIERVSDYSVEDGVYNFARSCGAQLIVIPTHGRSGLAHFFKGSIGEDMANHVDLPVLTIKI